MTDKKLPQRVWPVTHQHNATAEDFSSAKASSKFGNATAAGRESSAETSGMEAHASALGGRGSAVTTGNFSHAFAAGDFSEVNTSGERAHAVAAGYQSRSEASGIHSIAAGLGMDCKAKAGEKGAIVLAEYHRCDLIGVDAVMVGERGVEPGKWYQRINGQIVEVTT